ncbi:hypothetical protein [Rugosimonospora africana]|uniref:Uncharacterized protein n=1 Tax=Rugosimonospora africana TaxID=556532 RepID=A0A8J3VU17_9ACTN|nr:hypothetical protein [Rugosimonospora africana]GIH18594.1 hypothetical protein Raf01_67660 [Rugosimonospora africana]
MSRPSSTAPDAGGRGAGSYRQAAPLSKRPALTARDRHASAPTETHPAGRGQPRLGLAGLTFVIPFFFLLAAALGGAEASLLVLGPLTTFALPVIGMIAFWWQDWPGTGLRSGWSGLVDTLIALAAGTALTVLGQIVVSRFDLRGLFTANAGLGHPPTFPTTIGLGASTFTAILQLTLVCERWPLRRLGRIWSGAAALVVSWAAAVVAYLTLVNLDQVPASMRAAEGLRNPHGPVPAPVYGALLITLGVWQVVIFVVLRGLPFTLIPHQGLRLLAGNLGIAAVTAGSFALLRGVAGWEPGRIDAFGGAVIASGLLVAMLFEGWPATRLPPAPGRTLLFVLVAAVATVVYLALRAYAAQVDFRRATVDDWVALASLNFLALGIVLHVAVWRRWPVVADRPHGASSGASSGGPGGGPAGRPDRRRSGS